MMTIKRTMRHVALCGSTLWLSAAFAAPLTAQAPNRSGPPELGPPPRLTLAPIQEHRLSNGLRVMLVEKHQVPVVQINVVVMAGSALNPGSKAGLATMMADMLDEGAGTRDALELADALDFLGVRLSTAAGNHTAAISLFTPLSKLNDALPLLADVVLRPTFPEEELERKRKSRLTQLLQQHDRPATIATVLFNKALYGDQHPYGQPSIGGEAAIRSLTVRDLREFHESYFRPNNAVLIVVGDVTAESVIPKLEELLGGWPTGVITVPAWPEATQVSGRQILLVDKPGAAQSEIRIGRIGVERKTKDYEALRVMNAILGGAFTSRLNMNLREEHGYSYGAFSRFSFRLLPGPFLASSAVQTDATDKALREFFNEFSAIREPVSDEELTRARNYLALQFPGNFQTVGGIAGNIDDLFVFELPSDYFNQFLDRVLAVTKDDVERVARNYVDPENVVIVVVGDREKIEDGVRALGLGPVRLLSIEDVLGPKPVIKGN